MARQLFIVVLLLLGLGAIHTAGTHRPLGPKPTDDPYAWLGPLPVGMNDREWRRRWDRLGERMVHDAEAVDVRRFVCRSPAEIGALPMMGSVVRYLDGLPASQADEELKDGLSKAAARGNWLARALLLSSLMEADDSRMVNRALQLAEWLHARGLGQLYSELESEALWFGAYDGGGNDPTGFMTAAAMRQDYTAQASIGGMLVTLDDPEFVSAGGRMLECAARARAFYRKVAGQGQEQAGARPVPRQ